MAWIATDKDGGIVIFTNKPTRDKTIEFWIQESGDFKVLSKEIERSLIGRELTWADEPVEIGEIKEIEQTELEALGTDDRAEFWKACVLHVNAKQGMYQHIDFADKMLEEYDKRFGSQISVNTEVFRIPDEELKEYIK